MATPTRTRRALVVAVALAGLGVWPLAAAAPPPAGAGRVDTIAGPGFCRNGSVRSPDAQRVRALAADRDGRLFFDTGPARAGAVGELTPDGLVRLHSTGLPTGDGSRDGSSDAAGPPTAGRLAPDGHGGVFIAADTKVVDFAPFRTSYDLASPPELAVSPVAGGASPAGPAGKGASGDGGPALAARFDAARSLATDAAGNLFVADQVPSTTAFRVRVVNRGAQPLTFYPGTPQQLAVAPGAIATVAGAKSAGAGPPPGLALGVSLRGVPPALAVSGTLLYIAASERASGGRGSQAHVWMVNLSGAPVEAHGLSVAPGAVATLVGPRPPGGAGAGAALPKASLSYVPGLAADADANVYLADPARNQVVRIGADGVARTFAGGAGAGFNGNDRPATTATLDGPFDVEVGPQGGVYIADQMNGQVRSVDAAGVIHAVPGAGLAAGSTCLADRRKPASQQEVPQQGKPISVAADGGGNVYVTLAEQAQVVRVDPSGTVRTVIASRNRTPAGGGDKAEGPPAVLVRPTALAWSTTGGLYVLDEGSRRVWFANFAAEAVTANGVRVGAGGVVPVAGNGAEGVGGDGGKALKAPLGFPPTAMGRGAGADGSQAGPFGASWPSSLATDRLGDVFIAISASRRVRMVDSAGTIATVAGEGASGAATSCCRWPTAVAADATGNILVADLETEPTWPPPGSQVWFVSRSSQPATVLGQRIEPGSASVVVGSGHVGDADDGTRATEAPLLTTVSLALDRGGDVYLLEQGADAFGPGIRRIDAAGKISTVAGKGLSGFNGDGLMGMLTRLTLPTGIAIDTCGNVVIADPGSDRVRRLRRGEACGLADRPAPSHDDVRHAAAVLAVVPAMATVALALVAMRRRRIGPAGTRG